MAHSATEQGETTVLLSSESTEPVVDESVRNSIRYHRSDSLARARDCGGEFASWMSSAEVYIQSMPKVVCLAILARRCHFIYDYSSDGLVAGSLYAGGDHIWAALTASVMVLPYLAMWTLLSGTAPQLLSRKAETSLIACRVLWLVFGIPACLIADIIFAFRYCFEEPRSPEIFHYMTLRYLLELIEGGLQVLLQGYISFRLWDPWQVMPLVSGEYVNPWLLVSSVLASAWSTNKAWSTLNIYADLQAGGSRVRFIKHMIKFGEGLAPSHFFTELKYRRAVSIEGKMSDSELRNLGRVASQSRTLEELRILDASWLGAHPQHFVVTESLEDFLRAPGLRHFELRGSEAMPGWIVSHVETLTSNHPRLQHAYCEGQDEPFVSLRWQRIQEDTLLRAASEGDVGEDAHDAAPPASPETIAEALVLAAERGSIESMRRLLLLRPHGLVAANCKIPDHEGKLSTPLCMASWAAGARATELLLLARAELDEGSQNGQTPLSMASQGNNAACLETLLAARADMNKEKNNGSTPVYLAAIMNSTACLRKLLEARADADKAEESGGTPAFVAAQENATEALRLLLAARADANKADSNGMTPVYVAAQENATETLGLLLRARADVDKAMADGGTPASAACFKSHPEALEQLLRARADAGKADSRGITPASVAEQMNSAACLALLLEARADVGGQDQQPQPTPIPPGHSSRSVRRIESV